MPSIPWGLISNAESRAKPAVLSGSWGAAGVSLQQVAAPGRAPPGWTQRTLFSGVLCGKATGASHCLGPTREAPRAPPAPVSHAAQWAQGPRGASPSQVALG